MARDCMHLRVKQQTDFFLPLSAFQMEKKNSEIIKINDLHLTGFSPFGLCHSKTGNIFYPGNQYSLIVFPISLINGRILSPCLSSKYIFPIPPKSNPLFSLTSLLCDGLRCYL